MGRGDKKSKKGKIWRGSFGNSRRRRTTGEQRSTQVSESPKPAAETEAPKPRKTSRKKSEA